MGQFLNSLAQPINLLEQLLGALPGRHAQPVQRVRYLCLEHFFQLVPPTGCSAPKYLSLVLEHIAPAFHPRSLHLGSPLHLQIYGLAFLNQGFKQLLLINRPPA